ncbi:hypothetical protein EV215_1347 [Hypnocyclicus thermotrophus]|uniref:Phosphoesterase n=1 Tax=Hypnocyclicus thermotrophus TaxID=1627895 RepID=A0AA46DY92_9FUSO|nr:metallophosphoesterase [Hypnocyclicus thermotrophus]TDT69806.1 hypothetical protein EV215_1347 [Hypnocyclicus thermotrophus]
MKILILSDSHSHFENIYSIYNKENPDKVIFAGDYAKDGKELSFAVDREEDFYIVKGNCDFFDFHTKEIIEIELLNKKFLITHGHLFAVKKNYDIIQKESENKGYDIVIFGHTHRAYYEKLKDIHYFNPGAAINGEYGILLLEDEKIEFIHKKL